MNYRPIAMIVITLVILTTVVTVAVWKGSLRSAGAEDGKIDISDFEFKGRQKLLLDGEWEFYGNRRLTEEMLQSGKYRPDAIVSVPSKWNDIEVNGKRMGGFGTATYRLRITGAKRYGKLAMKIMPQSTVYRLYIDDDLLVSSGKLGENGKILPDTRTHSVTFLPKSDEFDVIFQVSNETYALGGMWDAPSLGTPGQIARLDKLIAYEDLFLLGNYFFIMFFCIAIIFFRQGRRIVIYYALLCFTTSVRIVIYGERIILYFTDSYRVMACLEYLTRIWFPILLALFLQAQFKIIRRSVLRGIVGVGTACSIFVLITPICVFTSFENVLICYELLFGLFCLIQLVTKSKGVDKWLFLFAGCILYLCGIYDILLTHTYYIEMTPIGFYVMNLLFAHLLSVRYVNALRQKDNALEELKATSEREKIAELKFLQSQIKPHFIYNALSAIANVCEKDAKKAEELVLKLAFFLRENFDFSTFGKLTTLENELNFVQNYIDIEVARFGEKIAYSEEISVPLYTQIPHMLIEPLVENSLQHGITKKKDGGEVRLLVKRCADGILVEVWDNGIGMDEPTVTDLLEDSVQQKGVGLSNVNNRLKKLYGEGLKIESCPGKYTRVSFILREEGVPV